MRSPAAATISATFASSVMSATRVTMSAPACSRRELVEALLRHVDGDDAAALTGDARRGGAADARAGARDDDGLAGEAALVEALDPLGALDLGDGRVGRLGRRLGVVRRGRDIRRARRHVAGGGARDEVVDHLLAELALAELDEPLDREALHGLQHVGVLPGLREQVADDRAADRVRRARS